MKRISSPLTRVAKHVAPVAALLILAGATVMLTNSGKFAEAWWMLLLVGLITLFATGMMWWHGRRLADEVLDGGDHLLVRRGSEQLRIRLDEIVNVSMRRTQNARRMELRLARPGPLGDTIVFLPAFTFTTGFNAFAKDPMEEDLIRRVDAARRKG